MSKKNLRIFIENKKAHLLAEGMNIWKLILTNKMPIIVGLALLLVIFLPHMQISFLNESEFGGEGQKQKWEIINEYRKTILQAIAGVLIIVGLWIANKRARAHEMQVNHSQEQVKVSQDALITERFSRAIEQLGKDANNDLPSVLEGFYTLDQIATESKKIRFQVLQVLTAYIWTNSPKPCK